MEKQINIYESFLHPVNFHKTIVNTINTNNKYYRYWGFKDNKFENFRKNDINILIFKVGKNILSYLYIDEYLGEDENLSNDLWQNKNYKHIINANIDNLFRTNTNIELFKKFISSFDRNLDSEFIIKEINNKFSYEVNFSHDKYAENIMFPYFCNSKEINYLHIEQENEFMLKPITKDTKRPDYVLQKNSPFSVYVDVKSLQFYPFENKSVFYLNVNAVKELDIFKPFLFFAIYDKNKILSYKEKNNINFLKDFPEPKFISLQKIKQYIPIKESYIIDINELNCFDEVMKETIVESFYNKKWI